MHVSRCLKRYIQGHIFGLFTLVLLCSSQAFAAAQTNRLVYLPDRDLEILYVGQKGQWCAPRLDLVLITSQPRIILDKKLIHQQMAAFIIKLRRKCPEISQVGITGYSRIEPDRSLLEGSYLAKDAWKFSKLKLPARFEPSKATKNNTVGDGNQNQQTANRALTFQEAQELRQRLLFLGFSVGKEEGEIGRQTALAISNFLTKYSLSLPVRADLNILLAVRKVSGAGGQVIKTIPKVTNSFRISNYKDTGNRKIINPDRLFSFWALHNTPNLLDNETILQNWLRAEGKDNQSPIQARAFALRRLYRQGTKFQRQDVLKTFRQLIEEEARTRKSELSQPLPIKIRLGARISGNYQRGKGFPLSSTYDSGFGFSWRKYSGRNEISYHVNRLGRDLHLPLPRRLTVAHVPIFDKRKARIFAGLIQDERRYRFEMRFYMTVKNVFFLTSGGLELQATNSVDRLMLEMLDRNDLTGKSKLVYKWTVQSPKKRQNAQAAIQKPTARRWARWAGIKVLNGNLVLGNWNKNDQVDFVAAQIRKKGLGKISRNGWAGFANLLSIQRNQSLLKNHQIALTVADSFLTQRERAELERGKNFLHASRGSRNQQNFNEFERREFVARFERGNYASRVKRYFPPFPLPFVNIQPVTLGTYNFRKGGFPITFGLSKRDRNTATWKPTLNLNMHKKLNLQRYPQQLSLSPDNAKSLLEMFKREKQNSRTVYLAIYGKMESVGIASAPGYYNVVANRVALFMDEGLRRRLAEFSLAELTAPGKKVDPTSLDISTSKLDKLYGITPVNEDQLTQVVEHFSDRKGFLGTYVRSMSAVQAVNELEKERVFREHSEELGFVKRPTSYWMTGWGKLGRYDTKRAGFPIYDWNLSSATSLISSVSAKFRTEFDDVKSVAFIKMERKRAAALLERYPGRHFLLRLKVTPHKATWQFRSSETETEDPQAARYAEATIMAKINEVYLLSDPNSDSKDEKALIAVKVLQDSKVVTEQ